MNPLDKIFAALGVLALTFAAGFLIATHAAHDEITTLKATYAANLKVAQDAKAAAEAHSLTVERTQGDAISAAVAAHDEVYKHEKARDDAVIADLRNNVVRLSVRTIHPAAGGPVPDAAAGAAGPVDTGTETLAGPVAARLAGRYADYNRIVGKLTECQDVIKADRLQPAQ